MYDPSNICRRTAVGRRGGCALNRENKTKTVGDVVIFGDNGKTTRMNQSPRPSVVLQTCVERRAFGLRGVGETQIVRRTFNARACLSRTRAQLKRPLSCVKGDGGRRMRRTAAEIDRQREG